VAAFRPTRAAAERAAAELTTRQADQPPEPTPVATKEWLAAHDAEAKAEDPTERLLMTMTLPRSQINGPKTSGTSTAVSR
jgi:hypothetical protein